MIRRRRKNEGMAIGPVDFSRHWNVRDSFYRDKPFSQIVPTQIGWLSKMSEEEAIEETELYLESLAEDDLERLSGLDLYRGDEFVTQIGEEDEYDECLTRRLEKRIIRLEKAMSLAYRGSRR